MENQNLVINNEILNENEEMSFRIHDESYSIRKDIKDASSNALREFVQNTMECLGVENVKIGELSVKGLSAKKIFIMNDGQGMNIKQLKKLRNLYGSDKNPNRKLNGNNNTGARLMSLNANMIGTCFISKTKEDGINACFFERDEDFNPKICMLNKENDKFGLLKDYSKLANVESKEWTIVIALGNNEDQNTFKQHNYLLDSNDNAINIFFENRYYAKPYSYESNTKMIDFCIEKEQVTFTEELYRNVDCKKWYFETNEAIYTVRYSETWGLVQPKSFILFENEMFDVQGQDVIQNIVASSNHFMRSLQATTIKDKLSIIVEPIQKYVKYINDKGEEDKRETLGMNNYRTIVQHTDEKNVINKLSLLKFIDDFKHNCPNDFKKFIKSKSNINENNSLSEELMNELLLNLDGRQSKGITHFGYDKPKDKKEDIENNAKEDDFVINERFEELLDKYPYIEYNLLSASFELDMKKEELFDILMNHCKNVSSKTRKAFKNLDNSKSTFTFLYNQGEEFLTRSLNNVFRDLKEFDKELQDLELMDAYKNIILYFVSKLKKDIKDGEVKSKEGKETLKIDSNLKPIGVNIYKDTQWKEELGYLKNSDKNFGIYDSETITINIDNKFFKDIRNEFEKEYLLKAYSHEEITEEMNSIFENVVSKTIGILGGYYNSFDTLPTLFELVDADDQKALDYILYLSSEQLSSNKSYIKYLLNIELKKYISSIE